MKCPLQYLPTHIPIIFIGMMGVGKTTIARAFAGRVGRHFVDLDHDIMHRSGVSIPTIFDIEGESGFRLREHKALQNVIHTPNLVLATGGGVVVNPDNHPFLRQGIVIYLHASADDLCERLRKDRTRPLLQNASCPRDRIRQLMKEREPLYESLAHVIIQTHNRSNIRNVVHRLRQRRVNPKWAALGCPIEIDLPLEVMTLAQTSCPVFAETGMETVQDAAPPCHQENGS